MGSSRICPAKVIFYRHRKSEGDHGEEIVRGIYANGLL